MLDTALYEDSIWSQWVATRDLAVRDILVRRYTPFIRMLAAQAYSRRFTNELEFADYLQFGIVALLEALERYQHEAGRQFESYLEPCVRGAILDGIAQLSEVQRQVATRREIIRERSRSMAREEATGSSALERLAEVALGLAIGFAIEESGMLMPQEEPSLPCNAYRRQEFEQLKDGLAELVGSLPEPWGLVIYRHYLQQQPFKAIADHLQVSRARVSQLHSEGLSRLRVEYQRRQGVSALA